jgi:hypothetical protein
LLGLPVRGEFLTSQSRVNQPEDAHGDQGHTEFLTMGKQKAFETSLPFHRITFLSFRIRVVEAVCTAS